MAQIVFCCLTQPNFETQIDKFLTLKTVRGIRQIVGRSNYDRSVDGLNFWANELKFLSNLDNLTCKISGLGIFEHDWNYKSVSGIIETCLNQFVSKHFMFG